MAIENFIPTLWSAKMLVGFREKAIFAGLANREYEGEASSGNTVKITGVVDVAVKDYKAGALPDGDGGTLPRTTTPDEITDTTIDLLINQEKNFDFYVDDIDRAQAAAGHITAGRERVEHRIEAGGHAEDVGPRALGHEPIDVVVGGAAAAVEIVGCAR